MSSTLEPSPDPKEESNPPATLDVTSSVASSDLALQGPTVHGTTKVEQMEAAKLFLSKQKEKKNRRKKGRRQQKETCLDVFKYVCLCVLAASAIASSILVIQSCQFFSYIGKETSKTTTTTNTISVTSATMVAPENDNESEGESSNSERVEKNNIFLRNNSSSKASQSNHEEHDEETMPSPRFNPSVIGAFRRNKHDPPVMEETEELEVVQGKKAEAAEQETQVFDEFVQAQNATSKENDETENEDADSDSSYESYYYSPFEDLPEATVGLFSYSMGNDIGSYDHVCFRYYDETSDYNLFRGNNDSNSIDYWIVARYCSICAPIAAFLAVMQLVLEAICCNNGIKSRNPDSEAAPRTHLRCRNIIFTLWFVVAGFLQLGTFVVMFAPPVLSGMEDEQENFCLSGSTIRCSMDTGAWFSLLSALAYLIVATFSAMLRMSPTTVGTMFCDDYDYFNNYYNADTDHYRVWKIRNRNGNDREIFLNSSSKIYDDFSTDSSVSSLSINSNYERRKEKERKRALEAEYKDLDFNEYLVNTIDAPSRRSPSKPIEHLNATKARGSRHLQQGLMCSFAGLEEGITRSTKKRGLPVAKAPPGCAFIPPQDSSPWFSCSAL